MGVKIEFDDRCFYMRGSNTQPLLSLNVESKESIRNVENKIELIVSLIEIKDA